MRRRLLPLVVLSCTASLGACEDHFAVPDLNNPGLESLEADPTRAAVVDATQGLLIGARAAISNQAGYVNHLGTLGREALTFDNSDPRYFDEMLAGLLNEGNGAFGGSGWGPRYANLRNANIVLASLDAVVGFSDAELEGIRGFAKTIKALDLLLVINLRDTNGAAIDVDRPLDAELAPLVSKDATFTEIVGLLNEAAGHLGSAGSSFPLALPGFDGFDTPDGFLEFNRALLARVETYRGNYGAVLTALAESFHDRDGAFDLGPSYAFGTGSGDVTNGLFQGADPQIVAHPTVWEDAPLKSGGERDDRVLAKVAPLESAKIDPRGVTSDVRFIHYPSLSSPVPIIQNEELILLEAEALWFTGDPGGAMQALNEVRTRSGGLAAITGMPAQDDAFIDALLEERRWSLLMEGGHRWLDMRRFDRLDDLPLDRPTDQVAPRFPIPRNECIARGFTNGRCSAGGA